MVTNRLSPITTGTLSSTLLQLSRERPTHRGYALRDDTLRAQHRADVAWGTVTLGVVLPADPLDTTGPTASQLHDLLKTIASSSPVMGWISALTAVPVDARWDYWDNWSRQSFCVMLVPAGADPTRRRSHGPGWTSRCRQATCPTSPQAPTRSVWWCRSNPATAPVTPHRRSGCRLVSATSAEL